MRKHRRDLEAADQAQARDHGRLHAGDVAALERMVPRVGGRNEVSRLKQVVLPAPFGPISAWICPVSHAQIDAVDGDEAAELAGQPVGLQDGVAHPRPSPMLEFLCARRVA